MKNAALREKQERKQVLVKYIPNVSNAIFSVLQHVANTSSSTTKKPRLDQTASSSSSQLILWSESAQKILNQVNDKQVTAQTLKDKLLAHVEVTDVEQAFDHVASSSLKDGNGTRFDVFLPIQWKKFIQQQQQDSSFSSTSASTEPIRIRSSAFELSFIPNSVVTPVEKEG